MRIKRSRTCVDKFAALRELRALGDGPAFRDQDITLGGWLLTATKLEDIPDARGRSWEDLERGYPLLRQDAEGNYVAKVLEAPCC